MEIFADMHVHIGRASNNKPIKITGSKTLTFENIVKEAVDRKGIDMVGIVDCTSPYVIEDIYTFLERGEAYELENGGIIYKDKLCILLGAEIETVENVDQKKGQAHNVCFFKYLKDIVEFSKILSKHLKNITLSTQRTDMSGYDLLKLVKKFDGIFIPAHVFTPFKSYYGKCTDRLSKIFKDELKNIDAIELGLSADTFLADSISELHNFTFLTSSDAHSLPKIAREYTKLELDEISFEGFRNVLKNNKVIANYGMNPKLGKYHKTYCEDCKKVSEIKNGLCSIYNSKKIVKGVFERIEEIKDEDIIYKERENRARYIYQLPLEFLPKIGKKTLEKLLDAFSTEMNILHKIPINAIAKITNHEVANIIKLSRQSKLKLKDGGGGIYGKVQKSE